MTPVSEAERLAIIDEVATYTEAPRLAGDEFTIRQYAQRVGCSHRSAWGKLKRMVDEGVLEEREVLHNGVRCLAYRRVA